jgi:zinc transporter
MTAAANPSTATNTPPNYGSDAAGLVCGYVFTPDNGGRAVDAAQVQQWLVAAEPAPGSFIWLHFNLANTAAERWMKAHLTLPPAYAEARQDGSRSSRIDYADDALIAVINDVLFDYAVTNTDADVSTIWLSVDSRMIVSARKRSLRSVDRLRESVRRGELFGSPADLLVHLLRDQADVLIRIVRDTVAEIDRIEDGLLSERRRPVRSSLGSLRRTLVRLQRLLAPEPAALFRLLSHPPAWLPEATVGELRESTEEFSAVLRDMASVQERIKLLQEEVAAHQNEQNGRSLFTLTVVTVLALPINITAGLLGMNVGGIPFAQNSAGFWIIVSLISAFTAMAGYWAFKKVRS